jgi:hypothetical protein|tara:strand:- start:282 stop:1478 length:1197 start_codon:yes stop_codon:yes gene_type:complete
MGLLTENNLQYYGGTQLFQQNNNTQNFAGTFDTALVFTTNDPTNTAYSLNNCELYQSADFGVTWTAYNTLINTAYTATFNSLNNTITTGTAIANGTWFMIQLRQAAVDNNYGSYEYISINDVVNNYLVAYVGEGKLVPNVKRTDVIFHAKRGLQEFSYDTLKSIKSQELQVPVNLSLVIPQDYVNIVRLSFIDELGVKRIIYPANNLTTAPYAALTQDSVGMPIQDANSNNVEVPPTTIERWNQADTRKITGNYSWNAAYNTDAWLQGYPMLWQQAVGERYGLNPSTTQVNGWYLIDERQGTFNFSSNLVGKLIVLEYISDGLATDLETKVPKLAEDAMYAHINHSILASKINQPEYIVQRFKRERSAKLRNAKIRLSNIKLDQIVQVMRGKSKWIKN